MIQTTIHFFASDLFGLSGHQDLIIPIHIVPKLLQNESWTLTLKACGGGGVTQGTCTILELFSI